MENLSLNDIPPSQGGPPPAQHPLLQPIPQLPPQMFTTAASLLDLTDKKLMVTLRDGRKVIGILRSWDQFGNLVLQDSVERTFAETEHIFADLPRGVFLVRGENVMLMGEIDLDKDDYIPYPYRPGSPNRVHELAKQEKAELTRRDARKVRHLKALGFEGESTGEAVW